MANVMQVIGLSVEGNAINNKEIAIHLLWVHLLALYNAFECIHFTIAIHRLFVKILVVIL